jgi:ATP-dependent Zn protease
MSELIAYHEAGHALMAHLLGGRVQLVTIAPDNDDGPARDGDTQVLWRRASMGEKQFAMNSVHVSLAGPAAEMIYSGEPYHPGMVAEWSADWQEAWTSALILHADERKRLAYLEQVAVKCYRQLKEDDLWAALAALADHLLAHETLEREQVEEIVAAWLE